ncbi:MAG: dihydrofolate reductase, partial [Candidatus Poseidoniales archaeon]
MNIIHIFQHRLLCEVDTMFTMIFACDLNGAIGKDGDLPWRQSSDLQHFKRITMSKT